MKTEKHNALNNEAKALNKKLAELTDNALRQVTGGRGEPSILDRIMSELSAWLDAHPNATKTDIYSMLCNTRTAYADQMTVDELNVLDELLNSFIL